MTFKSVEFARIISGKLLVKQLAGFMSKTKQKDFCQRQLKHNKELKFRIILKLMKYQLVMLLQYLAKQLLQYRLKKLYLQLDDGMGFGIY